jgi:ribosome-binding protein aMBF1 (putative translation factor)
VTKKLDTSFHKRMLDERLADPEFKAAYERATAEIAQVDAVIRQLDELRISAGLSKAELARHIERDPSSIRRLFSAQTNPELRLVASIAVDLGVELKLVPKRNSARTKQKSRIA